MFALAPAVRLPAAGTWQNQRCPISVASTRTGKRPRTPVRHPEPLTQRKTPSGAESAPLAGPICDQVPIERTGSLSAGDPAIDFDEFRVAKFFVGDLNLGAAIGLLEAVAGVVEAEVVGAVHGLWFVS